eukprot:CAMPEP_0114348070 /NCGR_PEP_ID=MMETSP0101-20121206/14428_1 /TAXON_ID=38822 ORGANISM="Pteridomonas danica, Strain PT" /NCGR_SAMPLE_ID=MMETSP0101 /ASSEMBLY_ACC=CAM_ASM_000211 /LENGTH=40 /DNA_ID= /DNA_START= /DNA_END= /DNA_ORIENTATION=
MVMAMVHVKAQVIIPMLYFIVITGAVEAVAKEMVLDGVIW